MLSSLYEPLALRPGATEERCTDQEWAAVVTLLMAFMQDCATHRRDYDMRHQSPLREVDPRRAIDGRLLAQYERTGERRFQLSKRYPRGITLPATPDDLHIDDGDWLYPTRTLIAHNDDRATIQRIGQLTLNELVSYFPPTKADSERA